MIRLLEQLRNDETGQDLVEYALLAALISIASVTALRMLGPAIAGLYESIIPHLQ